MGVTEGLYLAAAAGVIYPYAVYPALLALAARARPRPVRLDPDAPLPSVSVVVAAYNEAGSVARRLAELTGRVAAEGLTGEVVLVSDGSNDGTADAARRWVKAYREGGGAVPVAVVELDRNRGKAAAVSAGVARARFEAVALADARQTWAPDALRRLLENFADPAVGAVSGELVLETAPGVPAGVGLYWKVETWLRRREALVGSTVGLTGSVCAVRRGLFRPVPEGTVLDDVYWPLNVVMQGRRVVFDGRARAFDRLPDRVGAEFRRKVRTLAGNLQLVARLPSALVPWRNPVWFALVSHKLMRLAVPWAFLAMFPLAWAAGGPVFLPLLAAQAAGTALGLAGLLPAVARRSRLASAAATFLVLNAAAWCAFWVGVSGRASRSWTKTRYDTDTDTVPVAAPAGAAAAESLGGGRP